MPKLSTDSFLGKYMNRLNVITLGVETAHIVMISRIVVARMLILSGLSSVLLASMSNEDQPRHNCGSSWG